MGLKKTILMALMMGSFLAVGQQKDSNNINIENTPLIPVNQIEVFPNPSVDFLMVSIANSTLLETKIEIHSVIGNSLDLDIEQVGRSQYRIDVKEFATGYYFLVIKDDQTQFKKAFKFLKK